MIVRVKLKVTPLGDGNPSDIIKLSSSQNIIVKLLVAPLGDGNTFFVKAFSRLILSS